MANLQIASLNCHGLNSAVARYIYSSLTFADIILLQETWLSNQTSSRLHDFFSESYLCFHSSAMEEKLSLSVYNGRPFGGTGILVRNHISKFVVPVSTGNPRVTAVRFFNIASQDIVVCSIYMPWNNNTDDHMVEFVSVLGCLQSVIDRHVGCQFVLGGDFNVEQRSRNYYNDTLQNFCISNNLCWSEPLDGSIHYTFHSDVNDCYSLIDHFICSLPLINSAKSTHILIDDTNTSDHLAISVTVQAQAKSTATPKVQDNFIKLQWEKADLGLYQHVLSGLLSQLTIPVEALCCRDAECKRHFCALETYYLELIGCLHDAAYKVVPTIKANFHKHWWTEELDRLKQECIEATNLWRQFGCPRAGDINSLRTRAKLKYKNAVKLAAQNADANLNDKLLDYMCSKDTMSFWKTWRKRFCMNKLKPAQTMNGRFGDHAIIDEFSAFYKNICVPNSHYIDEQFACRVESVLHQNTHQTSDVDVPFVSVDSLCDCIQSLKLRKAAGHDGVTSEHIAFGGNDLAVHVCLLFNSMLRHSFVPNDFRFGLIRPVLKDKHGDITSTDMYRPITLTPVMSKLFESVLLQLYGDFLKSDNLQFGFKKETGCCHALFTFTESVKHFVNKGSKVHCTLLDASKAFDKVLLNGLYLKLIERGAPFSFIRILRALYSGLQCAVVWNGIVGHRFDVKCGVRQGGVLSPYLFSVYVDDLIKELRQSGHGIYVGTVFVGCILYADDIVLLSGSCYGLQKMTDLCINYGDRFGMRFNPSKSQTTVFGGRAPSCFVVNLNDTPVPYVDKVKYLGVFINSRTNCVDPSAALRKFFGCFNNIMSVLGYGRDEMLAVYLAKTYCLPILLYGCEIWHMAPSDKRKIDVAWNNCFRKIFNTCWRESVKPLLFYCSTMPASLLADQMKMIFYNKTLYSNNIVLRVMCTLHSYEARKLFSVYRVTPGYTSNIYIKRAVWYHFSSLVQF